MIRIAALVVVAGTAVGAEPLRPAELPPAGYAGLQYVDSKGCMFARAGNGAEVLWIPRVSRKGVPVCGNPPSGQRVPVVEEVGVRPLQATETTSQAEPAGGYFVAVGSYGKTANADRVEARLAELGYAVVRGRIQRGSGPMLTVFAGPFPDAAAATAARQALKNAGFADAILIGP